MQFGVVWLSCSTVLSRPVGTLGFVQPLKLGNTEVPGCVQARQFLTRRVLLGLGWEFGGNGQS